LPNALPKVGPVVINEIMYNPQTGGYEFIELANLTGEAVPLHDAQPMPNPWEFSQGLDFEFPPGASVPANGYALVVKVDPAEFLASLPSGGTPGAPNTAGPPQVVAVVLNPDEGRTVRGVSGIDPSALGVETVRITFSEEVVFAPGDVAADKVEFDDEGNQIATATIPAENFTASATAPTVEAWPPVPRLRCRLWWPRRRRR